MNIRQELLTVIKQLSDEQLSALLDLALSLKSTKDSVHPIIKSQAYQTRASAENDIHEEIFADPESKKHHLDRRAFLNLPVTQRNVLLSHQATTIQEHFEPGAEGMEWVDEYIEDQTWDDE